MLGAKKSGLIVNTSKQRRTKSSKANFLDPFKFSCNKKTNIKTRVIYKVKDIQYIPRVIIRVKHHQKGVNR